MILRLRNVHWWRDDHLPGNWPRADALNTMGSFVRQMNVSIFYQTWISAIDLMKGLVSGETVVLYQ